MPKPMTLEQRKILEFYKDTDVSAKDIALKVGVFYKTVFVEYRECGGRHLYNAEAAQNRIEENLKRKKLSNQFRKSAPKFLTLEIRKEIERLKFTDLSGGEIAKRVGKHKNVVNREFRLAGGRDLYDAEKVHQQFLDLREAKFRKFRKTTIGEGSQLKEIKNKSIDEDLGAQFANEIKDRKKPDFEKIQSISQNSDIPRLPLKIWVDRWKEEKSATRKYWYREKKYFEFWLKRFGNEIAVDIKPVAIEGASDELLKVMGRNKRLLGAETRRKYLTYLSSLYSTAVYEWKWAIFNPLTCVKMVVESKPYQTINTTDFPEFDAFKIKFISMVTERTVGMTQREAAKKAGLVLHTFQYAMDPKSNMTIKVFMKICLKFGIKVSLD